MKETYVLPEYGAVERGNGRWWSMMRSWSLFKARMA